MTVRSLSSTSSIPREGSDPHEEAARGGEVDLNDWRYWFNRAYRAWLAKDEQLCLFEETFNA